MKKILSALRKDYLQKKVLVCISGGLDSTVLAFAFKLAGIDISLFFASSLLRADEMKFRAELVAEALSVPLHVVTTEELKNPIFLKDPQSRCYVCKQLLYKEAVRVANSIGVDEICDGTNLDDLKERRPGIMAAEEFGIRLPFVEMKLGKKDILKLNEALKVGFPDEPTTCFATRFPDKSSPVNPNFFDFIYTSEKFLKNAGFKNVRVRFLKDSLLFQVDRSQVKDLLKLKKLLKYPIGYKVHVDSRGYRSLSEILSEVD